jgi:hypothetical protein
MCRPKLQTRDLQAGELPRPGRRSVLARKVPRAPRWRTAPRPPHERRVAERGVARGHAIARGGFKRASSATQRDAQLGWGRRSGDQGHRSSRRRGRALCASPCLQPLLRPSTVRPPIARHCRLPIAWPIRTAAVTAGARHRAPRRGRQWRRAPGRPRGPHPDRQRSLQMRRRLWLGGTRRLAHVA